MVSPKGLASLRMTTIDAVRKELVARRGEFRALSEATGLSYWWVTKFAQGQIAEPAFSRIDRLREYFRTHPRQGTPPEAMGGLPPQEVA